MMIIIREAPPQKKRENVGIFPSPPPVWEPYVCEKKNYGLLCILGP